MTRHIYAFLVLLCSVSAFSKDTIPLKNQSSQNSQKMDPAPAGEAQPYVASLGVYGSSRLNETMLRNWEKIWTLGSLKDLKAMKLRCKWK